MSLIIEPQVPPASRSGLFLRTPRSRRKGPPGNPERARGSAGPARAPFPALAARPAPRLAGLSPGPQTRSAAPPPAHGPGLCLRFPTRSHPQDTAGQRWGPSVSCGHTTRPVPAGTQLRAPRQSQGSHHCGVVTQRLV